MQGEGTTVEVLLPQAHTAEIKAETHFDITPSSMPQQGEANLLVVDDAPDVRSTTAQLLRRMGYGVTEASGAEDALAVLITDSKIDLMLTDVVMPDVSGLELALQAADLRPSLPIVFFTGYADPESIIGTIPLTRLLRKPFRAAELVALIETALAEARIEQSMN
jgi:DNA-binding NtrC family response regulator